MSATEVVPVLSVRNLKKSFADKEVVKGVSFDLYPGQAIALVGENGAGKSTTKNMLCGLLNPSAGEIFVDGERFDSNTSRALGISAVHQELSLFGALSVAQNMCISELPGCAARIDWQEVENIAQRQLDFLGIDIDPSVSIESLGAGKQQTVEIGKALLHADKVLILDEPTTSLTAIERDKLFSLLDMLKTRGVAIVFISHFMEEIYRVCDQFVTLRDGEQVGSGALAEVSQHELEKMMVGRVIDKPQQYQQQQYQGETLKVESLSSADFKQVSLTLQKGEIVGIAGLMGAGRTELCEAIMGLRKASGKVFLNGEQVQDLTVAQLKAQQVCYLPEDRRTNGLFLNRPVRENLSAADISAFVKRGLMAIGFNNERNAALELSASMGISIPHIEVPASALSGGNQQKVLLSRWLALRPKILILDEPTKGVDIGAKFDIHKKIKELAKNNAGILLASSDLPELLNLSHRILVMRRGKLVGEFKRENFDAVKIISLAASSGEQGVAAL